MARGIEERAFRVSCDPNRISINRWRRLDVSACSQPYLRNMSDSIEADEAPSHENDPEIERNKVRVPARHVRLLKPNEAVRMPGRQCQEHDGVYQPEDDVQQAG